MYNPTNLFPKTGTPNETSSTCDTFLAFCTNSYFSGPAASGNGNIPCLRGCNPMKLPTADAIVLTGVHTLVNRFPVTVSTLELDACKPKFFTPHINPFTEIIHLPSLRASIRERSVAVTIPPLINPSSNGIPNPQRCGSPLVKPFL